MALSESQRGWRLSLFLCLCPCPQDWSPRVSPRTSAIASLSIPLGKPQVCTLSPFPQASWYLGLLLLFPPLFSGGCWGPEMNFSMSQLTACAEPPYSQAPDHWVPFRWFPLGFSFSFRFLHLAFCHLYSPILNQATLQPSTQIFLFVFLLPMPPETCLDLVHPIYI